MVVFQMAGQYTQLQCKSTQQCTKDWVAVTGGTGSLHPDTKFDEATFSETKIRLFIALFFRDLKIVCKAQQNVKSLHCLLIVNCLLFSRKSLEAPVFNFELPFVQQSTKHTKNPQWFLLNCFVQLYTRSASVRDITRNFEGQGSSGSIKAPSGRF